MVTAWDVKEELRDLKPTVDALFEVGLCTPAQAYNAAIDLLNKMDVEKRCSNCQDDGDCDIQHLVQNIVDEKWHCSIWIKADEK